MVKAKREVRTKKRIESPITDENLAELQAFYRYLTGHPSIDDLARLQGVKPFTSLKELRIPELAGEDIDELLAIWRDIRRPRG